MRTVFETGVLAGNWWSLVPIAVAAAVLGAVLVRRRLGKDPGKKLIALGAVFVVVGLVLVIQDARTYRAVAGAYRDGHCLTVEGPVEDFVPAASRANPYETFTVEGVHFVLGGEAEGHFGYDRTSVSGGAIDRDGEQVKIYYLPYHGINVIVRLDVTD